MLERRLEEKGVDKEPLKYYIESFRHAAPPHAGAGIGLERVVFLYLGTALTLRSVTSLHHCALRVINQPYIRRGAIKFVSFRPVTAQR